MFRITKYSGRICLFLLCMLTMLLLLPKSTLAAEESIASIDIDVELMPDGSANITEIWDIIEVYDGTEYYVVMNLPENMSVHSLEVRDESGKKFQTLDSWDVDATFEEKAYKAGILETDDGYELCWGISSYGNRTFTVRYTLTNLVEGYTDYAGLYHQFITEDLSSVPESVSVNIHKNGTVFSEENTNMWKSGFDGDASFTNDGAIFVTSNEPDYVNIMLQFNPGLFNPAVSYDSDFASIRDEKIAEEEPMPILHVILIVVGGISVSIAAIIWCIVVGSRIKLSGGTTVKKPRIKDVEPRSILPFNGSLPATYYALRKLGHPFTGGEAFASYLMKWESEGFITIEKLSKKKINIIFNDLVKPMPSVELTLYQLLCQAAAPNNMISIGQIKKWASEGYDDILEWEKELATVGRGELLESGIVGLDEKKKVRFTQLGYEKIVSLYGFMKYLKDYELFQKESDMQLWGNHLIFATLLGMTDDVKEYFEVHADAFEMDSIHIFQIMLLTNMLTDATVPKFDGTDSNMTGMGGGFSGGGGGGGSR